MRLPRPRHGDRRQLPARISASQARRRRHRPRHARRRRHRAAPLPCRRAMLGAGADRQRLRPASARFLDAARRGARPQHARAARQAGASRRARGRTRLLLRKESRMSRPVHESDMATELQLAAQRHELFLEYQPQLDLRTGDLAGVEALMRWQSPTFGRVRPDVFIPLAERTGAIDDLTEWGLRTALWQWLAWRDQGVKVGIAFNISALTLRDVDFPDYLQRLCLQ